MKTKSLFKLFLAGSLAFSTVFTDVSKIFAIETKTEEVTTKGIVKQQEYPVYEDAYVRNGGNANRNYNYEEIGAAHGAEYAGKGIKVLSARDSDIIALLKVKLPTKEEIETNSFNKFEMIFDAFKNPSFNNGDQTYYVNYSTDTNWSETTVTWNSLPSGVVHGSENVLGSFDVKKGTDLEHASASEKHFVVDVTDKVRELVEAGTTEITVFVTGKNTIGSSIMFHSKETSNQTLAPKLVASNLTYTIEELAEVVTRYENELEENYTADSFKPFKEALTYAKEIIEKGEEATQEEIKTAIFTLEETHAGLVSLLDPEDANNIAYKKPTRSNLNNLNTKLVNDGDITTSWQAKFYPSYVDVDLMDTYDISEIILNFPTDKAVYYTLYGSNDGKNYDEIYKNFSDDKKINADTISLTDCSYRIIRVYIEYVDTNNASYLSEIRVHGTKTDSNTAELRNGTFEEITGIKDYNDTEYAKPITVEETIENVYGIIDRTVGAEYRDWFDFEITPNTVNDYDYFELSNTADGKVLIKGNEGLSLTTGLNYYYKNYANVQISEQSMQNDMPEAIVPIDGVVRKETAMKTRYAYNYCTLSYTYAFFGEEEWQRENDWLALNGVNVVLDLAGQEATWIKFLMNYNYSFDEAKDWLVGPGYYAWQFMDNMDQFGGPIPDGYVIDRVELARSTQRWKNSLGMNTVLQGYAGMVPNDFKDHMPEVEIINQPTWGGFDRPDMIATDSELYDEMAELFYDTQKFIYGETSDYYAVDPFHEGGTRPSGLTDDTIAREVLESLLKADDKAIWVVQAWQSNPTNALLDGMAEYKDEHCLIVDLIKYPMESNLAYKTSEFKNTNWAWCLLGNFGGNPTMNGQLQTMVDLIQTAKKERSHMVGIGIISEAMYDNPIVYDLVFDLAWADESFDLDKWIESYIERRYGSITENAKVAWDLMKDSNYASGVRATPGIYGLRPSYGVGGQPNNLGKINIGYDSTRLENALRLLVEDFDQFKNSEAYLYDITEIMRQVVSNYATMKHNEIIDAKNAKDLDKFLEVKEEFLNSFDVMDKVLSTQKDLLGGEWIGKAQDRAEGYDDFSRDIFEMNAKSIITTWGNGYGGLIDYGYRTYQGIFTDLIKSNWVTHLDKVEKYIRSGTSITSENYRSKYWKWVVGDQEYTRVAKDSPEEIIEIATEVLDSCVFAGELDPNIGNIALDRTAKVNGKVNGKTDLVTDGKAEEALTVKGINASNPEVIVDLIGVFDISKIQVLLEDTMNTAFDVYTSLDNVTWEKVASKSMTEENELFGDLGKTARFVKVVGTEDADSSNGVGIKVKEIRVFGNGTLPSLDQLADLIEYAESLDLLGNPKSKIDKFNSALKEAKDGLASEINPDNLSNIYWNLYDAIIVLETKGWVATACSQHTDVIGTGGDGAAMDVLDGNDGTYWHSNWGGSDNCVNKVHWIQINFREEVSFNSIEYTARRGAGNGTWQKATVIGINEDGSEVELLKDQTITLTDNKYEFIFDETQTFYGVKFVIEGKGGFGSAAEIKVTANPEFASEAEIIALMEHAEELLNSVNEEEYKKYSFATFKKAVDKVLALDPQDIYPYKEFKVLTNELETAYKNLRKIVYNVALNKPVTAHNGTSGNPKNMVDGNLSTKWDSGRLSAPGKPYEEQITEGWNIVDLKGLFTISNIQVSFERSDIWYQYELYSSLDGETWTKLGEKKTQNKPNKEEDTYVINDQFARYIKIQTTNIPEDAGKRYSYGVTELTVLGSDVADKTALEEVIKAAETLSEELYTVDSWKAFEEVLDAAIAVNDNVRAEQEEVNEAVESLEVAMDNLEKAIYTVTVNGEVVTTGKYNEKVTVTAPVVEGQTFTAWLWNGKVVSTEETYTFFLSEDMELTASYEAVEMNAEALLTNTMLVKRADSKADVKFVAQLVVPTGYTVENAGLVWSSKEEVELSLENTNLKPTYITRISNTNQFSVTIKGMPTGKFIRGRIFATLVDAEGNETVVYSDEARVVNK